MARDLYDILGIPRYASIEAVRPAFKKLALKYHPDRNPGNPEAEEKFKQISNAYQVLSDTESKRAYDLRISGFMSFVTSTRSKEEKEKARKEKVERVKRWRARKEREEIIREYEKLVNGPTPLYLRRMLNWMLMLVGIQFIFRNWFYTEESFSPISFFFAALFIIVGDVREQSFNYRILLFKNLKQRLRFDLYNRVIRNFLLVLVMCFAIGIISAHGLVLYHFKYYSMHTVAEIKVKFLIGNNLDPEKIYVYRIEGKKYTKRVPQGIKNKVNRGDKVWVRYSYLNPVFSKIIEPSPPEGD